MGNMLARVNRDPDGLLQDIRCFALDMDGTIYLGERWIDGALDFLRRVEETGRRFVFLTNNSSKNAGAYFEKLDKMGLQIRSSQLVTSGQAMVAYLQQRHPGERVFLLGNELLAAEFAFGGIPLTEDDPQLVVTAFDTSLTYDRLWKACNFVREGLPYLATHPDYNCPTEDGYMPDIGAIHAFIEASTGRRPDRIIGKPNKDIVDYMLEVAGCDAQHTAMVGDRLYTDIAAGMNNGLRGILVLSGESSLLDLNGSRVQPDLIFDSIREMTGLL